MDLQVDELNFRYIDGTGVYIRHVERVFGHVHQGVAWRTGSEEKVFPCSIFEVTDEVFSYVTDIAAGEFSHINSFLRVHGVIRDQRIIVTERVTCTYGNFFDYCRRNNRLLVRGRFPTEVLTKVLRGIINCMQEFQANRILHHYICSNCVFLVGKDASSLQAKFLLAEKQVDRWTGGLKYQEMEHLRDLFKSSLLNFPDPKSKFDMERASFCNLRDYSLPIVYHHPFLLNQKERARMPLNAYTSILAQGYFHTRYQINVDLNFDDAIKKWERNIQSLNPKIVSKFKKLHPDHGNIFHFESHLRFIRNHVAHGRNEEKVSEEQMNNNLAERLGPSVLLHTYDFCAKYPNMKFYY